MFSMSFYISVNPLLPFNLSGDFDLDPYTVGMLVFYFLVIGILVSFSMLFVPHSINKTNILLIGAFLLSLGSFLSGPSKILGLPDVLSVVLIGVTAAGVGKGLILCFFWGYILKSGIARYPE